MSPHYAVTITAALALLAAPGCSKSDAQRADPAAGEAAAASAGKVQGNPEGKTPIRVTGIPDENPTELARSYEPLVTLLEAALEVPVEYVPVTDYGAAVQALVAGKVDFAWLGGFTHVQARNLAEVVPVAMRDIDREFHSVFIAHVDSGIDQPADLAGKRFAFGSKSSTSGHLMPRHFLIQEFGIDPDTEFDGDPVFTNAHDATAKIVESGRVQGGVLNMQVWERMVAEGQIDTDKVKVIWTTPPYVDYVWTARAAVPEELRARFQKAFLTLSPDNPAHQPVLERLGAEAYVPAQPSDFDAIEAVARKVGLLR
ncbi:putative selenate ABC transporter substrate-binding protein [Haliangium sp.]|uniref:putative selenate ABC transporter substrate-binding protein n=1 Tax=Haliangium sp. TaxID=2663208 RepID=UPI003D09A599